MLTGAVGLWAGSEKSVRTRSEPTMDADAGPDLVRTLLPFKSGDPWKKSPPRVYA